MRGTRCGMSDRTWFITGASRGLGRAFAQAALAAGDRVAATARNTADLDALVEEHGDAVLPVELDRQDGVAMFGGEAVEGGDVARCGGNAVTRRERSLGK